MEGYAVRRLGPPEVRRDGLPLAFKSRKALALLACLTLEAHSCARESLAALLWPDSAPGVARSALRNTLSQLRTLLDSRLTTNRQTVTLTWTALDDLDLHRLRQGDPTAWRGALLEDLHVESEAFESGLTGQREALQVLADRAFDRVSARQLDDDPGAAADLATRWLALDRLNEAAWRRLIVARLAAGHMHAAREALETCRTVLQEELALDPAPETLALEVRLRPAVRVEPAELPAFLVGGALVGRRAEFERLVGTDRQAASGLPQAVLVSGEPGIGKTRPAGELLAWVRERGAPLLRGRALKTARAPKSRATLASVTSRCSASCAASSLNSAVYARRVPTVHLALMVEAFPGVHHLQASPQSGQAHFKDIQMQTAA